MLTVVVPTYNRPDRLARALRYWGESPFTVVVADGSREPLRARVPVNVDYRYDPTSTIFARWGSAINSSRTPYTVLCADDDFHGFSALQRCLDFLEQHRDYSSAQGRYLYFREGRKDHVSVGYSYAATYAVTAESAAERMIQSVNPYMHQIYSVHRSEVLKEAIGDFPEAITVNAFEVNVNMISAIFGKHRVLPFFYCAREAILNSSGARYDQDQFSKWVSDPRHATSLDLWRLRVANVYARVEGTEAVDSCAVFDRALRCYLKFLGGLRKTKSIRPIVPRALMNLIRVVLDRYGRNFAPIDVLFGETATGSESRTAFDWSNVGIREDWSRICRILE